jgi:hypothetical protein
VEKRSAADAQPLYQYSRAVEFHRTHRGTNLSQLRLSQLVYGGIRLAGVNAIHVKTSCLDTPGDYIGGKLGVTVMLQVVSEIFGFQLPRAGYLCRP